MADVLSVKIECEEIANEIYNKPFLNGKSLNEMVEEVKKYQWIPLKHDENGILCNCPDDGQETLVTDGFSVWIDTWYHETCNGINYVYADNSDIGDIKAWMPLPEPYKGEE